MKPIARRDLSDRPITLLPGDTLTVDWYGGLGHPKQTLATHTVDKTTKIDTIVIAEVEPGEFGLKGGLAALIGETLR